MRTMLQNHRSLSLLGLAAIVGFSITSCSSSQPYIDTDGIYNNEKYKPVETHENNEYYTKYFEEKKTEADHFTDIDNYTSYSSGAPAWGDSSSETIIYNYGGGYYNDWMSPWGFGWNSPYYSWGWGSSFWGWGYPYYGWGSGYYGWYSPYYYGYGYSYPFYGTGRNVSYASNHRTVGDRFISLAGRNTNTRTASRQMNNTTLANSRNISTARIQNNTRISSNVPTREYNTRTQNNNNRNQTINRNEINRSSTPTMRTTTPSTGRSMSTGGMGGGGRSMSTGGGRR